MCFLLWRARLPNQETWYVIKLGILPSWVIFTLIGEKGGSMGPIVCKGLREAFPNQVGCQGVGGKYTAALADNGKALGTTDAAIAEGKAAFQEASTKCPNSIIVFGGYRYVPMLIR